LGLGLIYNDCAFIADELLRPLKRLGAAGGLQQHQHQHYTNKVWPDKKQDIQDSTPRLQAEAKLTQQQLKHQDDRR
ncbi:MAG: hypothetical protein V2J12_08425, partial [Gammaproteobacteria bacterium]|nr:hypothetical protein [Gammaproteobacteria bacterium]